MNSDLLYQIALTDVPQIGDVWAKALVNLFGNAEDIFKTPLRTLEKIEGIGTVRAHSIKNYSNFESCEKEIEFLQKYNLGTLFLTDTAYPQRLLQCYDSPALLYYKGSVDFNERKIVSIVGTRSNSDYGRHITEQIVAGLQHENVLVISGLAFGIDTIAHKAAIKNQLNTVAVVAHGLDRIYPTANAGLAKDITSNGALLSEFRNNTMPDRPNFPRRNRIVAGMCDALIVVETGVKGGSLITAELANGYNKDVFAIPGRVGDSKSEGCNLAIKKNKATLITNAEDLLDMMNWNDAKPKSRRLQRALFIEFTPDEQLIVDLMQERDQVHIDEIFLKTSLSSSKVSSALLMLEMQNVVSSMPGKMYALL